MEVVLRIFIALKTPSHLAEPEPVNFGSNDKYGHHDTTEDD
jgi:hypothetical protein